MRTTATSQSGKLHTVAIAGTRAILIALNLSDQDRKGLMGFSFQRSKNGEPPEYLSGMKVFPSLAPKDDDKSIKYFTTDKNPIQSFLWSDYEATPGTKYEFTVTAMYGRPGNLEPRVASLFPSRASKQTTAITAFGSIGERFSQGFAARGIQRPYE